MKFILNFGIILFFGITISNTANAQKIKNSITVEAKVLGNCGMCKKTIEKAAFIKGEAMAVWDDEKQLATVTYDEKKTNLDAILKRIADVGYDNQKYKAADDVYNNLHGCCQYDRIVIQKEN